jgi:hypothetical protein
MVSSKVSHFMAGLIPSVRKRICADAAHVFLFQYPTKVAAQSISSYRPTTTTSPDRRFRQGESVADHAVVAPGEASI